MFLVFIISERIGVGSSPSIKTSRSYKSKEDIALEFSKTYQSGETDTIFNPKFKEKSNYSTITGAEIIAKNKGTDSWTHELEVLHMDEVKEI